MKKRAVNKGGRPKDEELIVATKSLIDPKTKKLKVSFREAAILLTHRLKRKVHLVQVQRAFKYALGI